MRETEDGPLCPHRPVCGCRDDLVCAKAEGEPCGGLYGFSGSCAAGLKCLTQCGRLRQQGEQFFLYH